MTPFVIICLLLLPMTMLSCSIFWTGNDNVPEDGLIAYYPFDGDARDAVGDKDGEVLGASPTEDRFGESEKALSFDGSDDFVWFPDSEAFNFDLRVDSYAISLWAASGNAEHWARLVIKWNELNPTPYPFALQKVEDELWVGFYDTQTRPTVKVPDLWDGAWHHIVASYDAEADQMAVYIDGEQAALSTAAPVLDTQNPSPLYIGRASPPREDRYFEGSLDEIRFYGRALTEEDVKALYRR